MRTGHVQTHLIIGESRAACYRHGYCSDLRTELALHTVPQRQSYSLQLDFDSPEPGGTVKLYGWTLPWDEYVAIARADR